MIGERLRAARGRARKTLREVSAVCDVTPQAIKKYEDDQAMPRSSVLVEICKCLDVSAEWLLAGKPLDFHSTETAPQGRHAKYWVREAIADLIETGAIKEIFDAAREDAP